MTWPINNFKAGNDFYINFPRVLIVWSFQRQLNFGECSYPPSAENNNKIMGLCVIFEIFVKSEQYK